MKPLTSTKLQSGLLHIFPTRVTSIATSLFIAVTTMVSASEAVLVSDDFDGAKGTPAARTPSVDNTGIPNNQWVWGSGHTYFEKGFVISAVTGSPMGGRVRIPAPTAVTEISCVAQMNTGIAGRSAYTPVDWVAVGFLAAPEADWYSADGGNLLWALVRPNGGWTLFEKGTSRVLAASKDGTQLPAFEQGFLNTRITLRYDRSSSQAALLVDGKNISGWHATTADAPRITAAGFHVRALPSSDPRTAKVDSFSVTTLSPGQTVN